jgi:hypothetical protein
MMMIKCMKARKTDGMNGRGKTGQSPFGHEDYKPKKLTTMSPLPLLSSHIPYI